MPAVSQELLRSLHAGTQWFPAIRRFRTMHVSFTRSSGHLEELSLFGIVYNFRAPTTWKHMAYAAVSASSSLGPVTDLHIVNKWTNLDGFGRYGVLAEGQFPGPLITSQKGQGFQINVIDELTNATMLKSTSIHWHGLFQHGTNWADGVSFVTQCPITTGDSFLYEFNPTGQAGTYWYHSHLSTQYCDGLRGPLVIYDPNDPYKNLYDVDNGGSCNSVEDTIITLADWYHEAGLNIPFPPAADSTLINGQGRYINGPATPLSVITVQHGKRYRMRLINMACDPNYIFSIDNHDMTIIEADGVNHDPVDVNAVQIFVGQRYSFILDATQPVGNYWIRAFPDQASLQTYNNSMNLAILRYVGAPNEDPTTEQQSQQNLLQETDLHPLVNPAAPGKPYLGGADMVIPLNLTFDLDLLTFFINNATFTPPNVPVLLQILSGAKSAQELLPPGSVYSLPKNAVIEIIIPPGNAPGGPHPFHLHGHTFSVIRSAGSSTYNYVNPPQRDVVSIGTGVNDSVTIRFTTDNPGPWFLHCHIDWHLQAGLAVVMAEDIADIKSANPVPQAWNELCPKYNALDPGDK
ncbi:hypothetical protein NM688_g3549 [Phlebia brevispora]|uniref:Uncharacterized protein n=1 Tax=Phlebia brevispora TaxID=194682 RepID=A0ACC1T5F7_9APHY|nr:hypothetical protein NM688_g3549 [Phlebia brevispora]